MTDPRFLPSVWFRSAIRSLVQMKEKKYNTYLSAAKSLKSDYGKGYIKGLKRHYLGDKAGSDTEHKKYIDKDSRRSAIAEGYRDGFAGKPPKGFHGNIGNLNAAGELPADSQLQIRVNSQIKARYVKQAQKEKLKLSQWVLKTLDDAVDS